LDAPSRKAVFLDRDGTIIADKDYLDSADKIEFIPGAASALKRLHQSGFLIVVISNQSGVARGFFSESRCREINDTLEEILSGQGVPLSGGIYYCPHLPGAKVPEYDKKCECRKPAPGLFLKAAGEHSIDFKKSWAVGDSLRDLEPAANLGAATILVLTGKGRSQASEENAARWVGHIAEDLSGAADIILGNIS